MLDATSSKSHDTSMVLLNLLPTPRWLKIAMTVPLIPMSGLRAFRLASNPNASICLMISAVEMFSASLPCRRTDQFRP